MAELTTPNYPTSYEDDSSLFAPLVDRMIATVKTGISVEAIQITLEEDLDGYQGDPCFMVFEGGEIWQLNDGDLSFAGGDTTVTLSSPAQRSYSNSPLQPHTAGEEVYFTAISHHQISFKEAIVAVQKNGFLVGTEAQKTTYESGAVAGEGWLATDNSKVYICFTAGTFTWVNILSHLDLTGTADDDHTQYHNNSRADTWHGALPKSHVVGDEDHDHRSASEGAAVLRVAGGADASKPGTPGYIGRIYFSIDTPEGGTLFVSHDGTSWIQISGAPTGAIAMWAGACPSGWSRYTALDDGVYPRVDSADVGTTGGGNTHTHEHTTNREHYHDIEAVAVTNVTDPGNHAHTINVRTGGGGSTYFETTGQRTGTINTTFDGAHGHTVTIPQLLTDSIGESPAETDAEDGQPPYKEIVFCQKD